MSAGDFWTQREWSDWSNELAMLIPEDDVSRYANPDGAQESVILACLRAYVTERAAHKCPTCHTTGHPHEAGGEECRLLVEERRVKGER